MPTKDERRRAFRMVLAGIDSLRVARTLFTEAADICEIEDFDTPKINAMIDAVSKWCDENVYDPERELAEQWAREKEVEGRML